MKKFLRRTLSLCLASALACSLGVGAAASEALGEDLLFQDTLLNEQTQLSTNVFWSTSYSDLRTENLITYTPNESVTPVVTYGSVLTACNTISSAAKTLESEGYRVVAGMNGDFYNFGTGLPIGLVMTEGQIRSSDGGYYAIGFRADGTAVLGKPAIKASADLGYAVADESGYTTQVVRQLAGVNKARVSTGGIYLYTYDFNAKHTTGTTEAGVDVLCTIQEGTLGLGEPLVVTVDEVRETSAATPIGENQVVLSANAQSNSYYVDALRRIPVGSTITFTATASSEEWNDVEYALGALYSLVENGAVVTGLPTGMDPRTAVGQKADGTLVFYTIDGRKSGHSIGASMTQVAQRLVELGCVTALCLDGGGSTTMTVTAPDSTTAKTVNTPSGGSERSVSNQVFLVADSEPTDELSHFYVRPDNQYVLAGSRVHISASAVDTNFIPMDSDFELTADEGELDGDVLTTPNYACDITVTAERRGKSGSTTVHAIETPDSISVQNGGSTVTSISVAPGSTATLTAFAMYRHLPLKADPEAFTWSVSGNIGTISSTGVFTATAPGSGTITVSAGGKSTTVQVTVSKIALSTLEDFEASDLYTKFTDMGSGMSMTQATDADHVRMGRGSGRIDYTLQGDGTATLGAYKTFSSAYSTLNFWVYGDGSGNTLSVLTSDGSEETETQAAVLDFTGWCQISVQLPTGTVTLTGLKLTGVPQYGTDEMGWETVTYPGGTGAIYVDQMVASYNGIVDTTVPAVTASLESDGWKVTGTILDDTDGVLPKSSVSVSYNGAPMDFDYNASTGKFTVFLPGPGETHEAMRVTVTARDASGNIGRASVDVEAQGVDHKFTDIDGYWGATYADFLYNAGITTGYDDGTFRPNQNISRAQFSVMLYRYLGLDAEDYTGTSLPFADLASIPAYALPAVQALYSEGIVNGTTGADGQLYFNPGASLTRAQAATMIGRTQEKGYATVELTFTDAASIPGYAGYYIQTMAAQGVIGGYADGSFRPSANITRGQMAKILYNLM